MQKFSFLALTLFLLSTVVRVTCTPSIEEYIFPSTPCLVHLVLRGSAIEQVSATARNSYLELDLSILSHFIFLTSSYSPTNNSSTKQEQDDDDTEDGQDKNSASSSLQESLLIGSKWRGGKCLRFFVLNALSFRDLLQDPQIMSWGSSETPEIFTFVSSNSSSGWNSESITNSKEVGDFNGFRANLVICVWKMEDHNLRSNSVSITFQKLGFLCYVCPKQTSILWMEEHDVMKMHKKLRRNGHKRKLFMKYGNDLTNYEEVDIFQYTYLNQTEKTNLTLQCFSTGSKLRGQHVFSENKRLWNYYNSCTNDKVRTKSNRGTSDGYGRRGFAHFDESLHIGRNPF